MLSVPRTLVWTVGDAENVSRLGGDCGVIVVWVVSVVWVVWVVQVIWVVWSVWSESLRVWEWYEAPSLRKWKHIAWPSIWLDSPCFRLCNRILYVSFQSEMRLSCSSLAQALSHRILFHVSCLSSEADGNGEGGGGVWLVTWLQHRCTWVSRNPTPGARYVKTWWTTF